MKTLKNKGNIQSAEKINPPVRVQVVMRSPDGSINHNPRPADISYGMIRKY